MVTVGVPKESAPGERRVAIAPITAAQLTKAGFALRLEAGAGYAAGFQDNDYRKAGATIVASRPEAFDADVVLQVRALGANPDAWEGDLALTRQGQSLIGLLDPLWASAPCAAAALKGLTAFSLELMPRITRAQAMDVLSSQANLAGYKAVLLAANASPKIFPMMITAAGTLTPARVFIIGAGVAGLQAIATAKRLGGVVSAYDVRAAVKEQVESVGARFVQLEIPAEGGEGQGGYARKMDAEFYARQAELMAPVLAENDVVITTAAIPGEKSPMLVNRSMVERMRPGSIVVDLGAERGGNCELTRAGETIVHNGVTIMGPVNLPSELPNNASQLFGRNAGTFLTHLTRDGQLHLDREDEITRETLVTLNGEVVHPRVRQRLGLPPLEPQPPPAT